MEHPVSSICNNLLNAYGTPSIKVCNKQPVSCLWNNLYRGHVTTCSMVMKHHVPWQLHNLYHGYRLWNTLYHDYGYVTTCSMLMEQSVPCLWNNPFHENGLWNTRPVTLRAWTLFSVGLTRVPSRGRWWASALSGSTRAPARGGSTVQTSTSTSTSQCIINWFWMDG